MIAMSSKPEWFWLIYVGFFFLPLAIVAPVLIPFIKACKKDAREGRADKDTCVGILLALGCLVWMMWFVTLGQLAKWVRILLEGIFAFGMPVLIVGYMIAVYEATKKLVSQLHIEYGKMLMKLRKELINTKKAYEKICEERGKKND